MKILITGGAGFIGSWLCQALLASGHEVIVVDNLSTGSRENVPDGARFIELDISIEKNLLKLPKGVDLVYHLASQASGQVSCEDPLYDSKNNAIGTLAILRWAKETGVDKFIFTSTMGVYADGLLERPTREDDRLNPQSFYGVHKLASEGYVRIYSEEGLRATTLRLFNVYGPGQNMDNLKQGMVSIYMAYVAKGLPVEVKGALDRFRDFVYIDDVVDALLRAQSSKADGKTYNVATGRRMTVRQVLNAVIDSFGHNLNAYPISLLDPTPRDYFGIYGANDLIHGDLGWTPGVKFEEGVKNMAAWVRGETEINPQGDIK